MTRSVVQTSSALQGNKWLAGAKVIYDIVQSKRAAQGQNTKPFMDWVGIQQEVERLSVGQYKAEKGYIFTHPPQKKCRIRKRKERKEKKKGFFSPGFLF